MTRTAFARAALAPACAALMALASVGCASDGRPDLVADPQAARPKRPAIDPRTVRIDPITFAEDEAFAFLDGRTGERLAFDDVLARARAARVVVVGEQHDQATHHDLQRRVVAALAQDTGTLSVGLEMLTWPAQPALDRFNRGDVDSGAFADLVDWKEAWGFDFDLYRPILDDGRRHGARFVALNAPRELVRAARQKGLPGLSDDERQQLPELDLGDDEHRAWFAEIFTRGHPIGKDDLERFYLAQVIWDESMADRAVRALNDGADRVVVIAGIGHIAHNRGIPQRVQRRLDGASVLSIVPLGGLEADDAVQVLQLAVSRGEGDILAVPRFDEALSL